jgi:predicted deacylase
VGSRVPDIAVVGSVHGDEPRGARAIERLVASDPSVNKSVELIVSDAEALERNSRFVDSISIDRSRATRRATSARNGSATGSGRRSTAARRSGFIDTEAGRQGIDQAAESPYQSILEFLTFTGVLDGSIDPSPTNVRRGV